MWTEGTGTSVHINMKDEDIYNGEEPYDRQCAKDNGVFCAALSFILFSANIIWDGGSVHHRTVLWQGCRGHNSGCKWISGHAHAHSYSGGTCYGNNCCHRKSSGGEEASGCTGGHRKYSHHLHDNISIAYSNAAHFYKSNSCSYGYPRGGCQRNHGLSDSLLYRNSIYNSIQRDKLDIQRTRRF